MKEGGCGTENEELRMLYGPKPQKRDQKRNEFRYGFCSGNARAIFTRGQGRVVDSVWLARVPAKKGRRKGRRAPRTPPCATGLAEQLEGPLGVEREART